LLYDTNDSAAIPQPVTACAALAKQNVGYVYVGTWYDTLPSYLATFLTDC